MQHRYSEILAKAKRCLSAEEIAYLDNAIVSASWLGFGAGFLVASVLWAVLG